MAVTVQDPKFAAEHIHDGEGMIGIGGGRSFRPRRGDRTLAVGSRQRRQGTPAQLQRPPTRRRPQQEAISGSRLVVSRSVIHIWGGRDLSVEYTIVSRLA